MYIRMHTYLSTEELRKLFVGMLSKTCTEEDIAAMFEPYGPIEDISILKYGDGASKGELKGHLCLHARAHTHVYVCMYVRMCVHIVSPL